MSGSFHSPLCWWDSSMSLNFSRYFTVSLSKLRPFLLLMRPPLLTWGFAYHTSILSISPSQPLNFFKWLCKCFQCPQRAKSHLQMYIMMKSLGWDLWRKLYQSEKGKKEAAAFLSNQPLCSQSSARHTFWGLIHSAKNSTLKFPEHKELWQSTGLHFLRKCYF